MTRTGLPAGGEGAVQGEHEVVAGSQCVRQDGPGAVPGRPSAAATIRILRPSAWLQAAMGIAVIAASAGAYIAAMPKRTCSAVVLTTCSTTASLPAPIR